jgi:hypothetical protein
MPIPLIPGNLGLIHETQPHFFTPSLSSLSSLQIMPIPLILSTLGLIHETQPHSFTSSLFHFLLCTSCPSP